MEVFHDAARLPRKLRAPAVAIGNFDGVHLGHQRIAAVAREHAVAEGGEAVALTFDPLPERVLAPDGGAPAIQGLRRRLECLAAAGLDTCVVQPFSLAFAARSPEAFVKEALIECLGVRCVVVGHDFTYGRAREGTAASLSAAGARAGFVVTIVPAVEAGGAVISSTRIRALVREGRLDDAAGLLGRAVEIDGDVVVGRGRGRTIGVPTANLRPMQDLLPPLGVYAAFATHGGERTAAVVNVGVAPTFGDDGPVTVEAHLLDFTGTLAGARIVLELRASLRGERRFPSVEALVEQIRSDIACARELLA